MGILRPKEVSRADKGYMTNEKYQDYAEQQFNNIYNCLEPLSNNEIISGSATSTSSSGEYKTINSITLSKGKYLILAACDSDSASTSDSVQIRFNYTDIKFLAGLRTYRGTMLQGGGISGWCIVEVKNKGIMRLQSYVKSSYEISGELISIPLL